MRVLRLVTLCSLLLVLVGLDPNIWAQSATGSIVGNITDSSGSVIVNANVTLTNNATGDKKIIASSTSGDFQFLILTPGEYRLIFGIGLGQAPRDPPSPGSYVATASATFLVKE